LRVIAGSHELSHPLRKPSNPPTLRVTPTLHTLATAAVARTEFPSARELGDKFLDHVEHNREPVLLVGHTTSSESHSSGHGSSWTRAHISRKRLSNTVQRDLTFISPPSRKTPRWFEAASVRVVDPGRRGSRSAGPHQKDDCARPGVYRPPRHQAVTADSSYATT